MKPTPTHPVPDLHKALKTLPLCAKCVGGGFFSVGMCIEESKVHTFMGNL